MPSPPNNYTNKHVKDVVDDYYIDDYSEIVRTFMPLDQLEHDNDC